MRRSVLIVASVVLWASPALSQEDVEPLDAEPLDPEAAEASEGEASDQPDFEYPETEPTNTVDEGYDLDDIEEMYRDEFEIVERVTTEAELAEPSTVTIVVAEPEPEPGERPPRGRLGPARLPIGDEGDYLQFSLFTQFEFDYEQTFRGAGLTTDHDVLVEFRRIRTTLSARFLDGKLTGSFQLNVSPTALELIDLWIATVPKRVALVRIGQFKEPYTRYRAQSFAALSFTDWSTTTRVFGSGRQWGIEVLGVGGFAGFEYSAGVFTGMSARAAHGVGIADFYGVPVINRSSLGDGEVFTAIHPELVARAARNFGKINTVTNTDRRGGPLRQSLGFSIAWDAQPVATEDLEVRFALEWLAKVQHVHINLIGHLAWFERWTNGDIGFGALGVLAEAGYRFSRMWELAARYSLTYVSESLRNDARAFGTAQIAAAPDPMEAMTQFGEAGDVITNEELALAGTAYFIGNSLKALAELAWESSLREQGRRNGLRFTLQLQFGF